MHTCALSDGWRYRRSWRNWPCRWLSGGGGRSHPSSQSHVPLPPLVQRPPLKRLTSAGHVDVESVDKDWDQGRPCAHASVPAGRLQPLTVPGKCILTCTWAGFLPCSSQQETRLGGSSASVALSGQAFEQPRFGHNFHRQGTQNAPSNEEAFIHPVTRFLFANASRCPTDRPS
jgi:hypothetical protein